jgi:hypothetical protein
MLRASAARKSLPPCRQCLLGAAGLLLAAAIAIAPSASKAQTPDADSGTTVPDTDKDLLEPKLQGSPKTLPRFRRPGERTPARGDQALPPGKFTAPSRIGATPLYGSPPASGAGETGFDSTNKKRRKTPAQTQTTPAGGTPQSKPETTFTPVPTYAKPPPPKPAAARKPPPPEIHPVKAAARPGATLPPPFEPMPISNPPPEVHPVKAASRPGAILPVPPPIHIETPSSTPPPGAPPPNTLPLGAVPQRPLPIAVGDPYAALGIRAGSFVLFPGVEFSVGHSSNAERTSGAGASTYIVAAPELQVRSDWERHAAELNIKGSYTDYLTHLVPSLDAPYLDSKLDGRIDVLHNTQIITQTRLLIATDNPGSPNLPAEPLRLPPNFDLGGTLGVVQTFNRLAVTVKGTFDRNTYYNSVLTDGETSSNGDRNFNQWAGIMRVAYDSTPASGPSLKSSKTNATTTCSSTATALSAARSEPRERSFRLGYRRDGRRLHTARLQGPDLAGYRRHDRQRRAHLAGDAADHRQVQRVVAGLRDDPARHHRNADARRQPGGRPRLPAVAHRHLQGRLRYRRLRRLHSL